MRSALVCLLFVLACNSEEPTLQGDGELVTRTASLARFHRVVVAEGFVVDLAVGEPSVELRFDRNLIDEVETEVSDDELTIRAARDVAPTSDARILVHTPTLDALEAAGTTRITGTVNGTGLSVTAVDRADVRLNGVATSLVITTANDARVDCTVPATSAEVTSAGDSECSVHASDRIKATGAGSALITVRGNPEDREVTTTGTARVIFDD